MTGGELRAAAAALAKAADRFERRALEIDLRTSQWRKDHRRDNSPVVSSTLHGVVRDLREWASRCRL